MPTNIADNAPNVNPLPSHSMLDSILGIFGSNKINYTAPPDPSRIMSASNTNGKIVNNLQSGAQATQPTPEISSALKSAYDNNPTVPAGHLEALTMKESSMGYDKSNYNPANGKFGYVFGLSAPAFKDTKTTPQQADTLEGAANIAAKYYAKYYKPSNDPATQYKQYYNRVPTAPLDSTKYNSLVNLYAQSSPQKTVASQ